MVVRLVGVGTDPALEPNDDAEARTGEFVMLEPDEWCVECVD